MEREDEDPVLTEYARLAVQYDRRWSFYIDATARETLKRLFPHPGDALLDVGCGTGTFLQSLSSAFPSVKLTGVDPSSAMLDIARAHSIQDSFHGAPARTPERSRASPSRGLLHP